jgi:hypothetical protein
MFFVKPVKLGRRAARGGWRAVGGGWQVVGGGAGRGPGWMTHTLAVRESFKHELVVVVCSL